MTLFLNEERIEIYIGRNSNFNMSINELIRNRDLRDFFECLEWNTKKECSIEWKRYLQSIELSMWFNMKRSEYSDPWKGYYEIIKSATVDEEINIIKW